jgi:hypothetical protein
MAFPHVVFIEEDREYAQESINGKHRDRGIRVIEMFSRCIHHSGALIRSNRFLSGAQSARTI